MASGWHGHTLTFSNGCILLTFGSIYTKLADLVKLGLHTVKGIFHNKSIKRVCLLKQQSDVEFVRPVDT